MPRFRIVKLRPGTPAPPDMRGSHGGSEHAPREHAAAGAIALINATGNLGGYVGPFVVGWIKDSTNSFEAGLYFLAASALGAAVITYFATAASGRTVERAPAGALASR